MSTPPNDVTQLLDAVRSGRPGAEEDLTNRVYGELRQIADRMMRREKAHRTLQATALVNEAWIALAGEHWESRRYFFGAAAQAMRRLLVDAARRRGAARRGGGRERVTLGDVVDESPTPQLELLELDAALGELERFDARLAETVRLRYFASMTIAEVAELQHVSPATVKRDWNYARAWLFDRMGVLDEDEPS
jgi:RNA polymerase sigma factor (TIGR02999 family)